MWINSRLILPLLLVLGQGTAEEQWSQPIQIGVSLAYGQVSAEANAKGDAVVVYNRLEYGKGSDPNTMWIDANTRCNGQWGLPQRISVKTNATSDTEYVNPKAAIDSDGYCYALWKYTDGGQEGLKSARLMTPCFTFWVQDEDFPMTPANRIDQYELALNKKLFGELYATAVWSVERNGSFYIEAAQFDRTTHAWSAIQPISLLSQCKGLDVKLDSQGVSWLIWTTYSYSDHKDVAYVTSLIPEEKQWALPQILAKGKNIDEPKIAIDPKDNVLVRWQQRVKADNYVMQIYKKRSDTSAWILTEFPDLKNNTYPSNQLTFDQKGNTLLLWNQHWNTLNSLSLSASSIKWTNPKKVLHNSTGGWESAIDKKGNRLLAWTDDSAKIQFMTLPAGSEKWSAPKTVAEQAYSNDPLFHAALSGDTALIIYQDLDDIKVIEGTGLFQTGATEN